MKRKNTGCRVMKPSPYIVSDDTWWGLPMPYKERKYEGPIDQGLIDQYKEIERKRHETQSKES